MTNFLESPTFIPKETWLSKEVGVVVEKCLKFHNQFDKKLNLPASYHNDFHIKATLASSQLLMRAAIDEGNDPLGLVRDLDLWNSKYPDNFIEKNELENILKLAFSCHDLGNIANVPKIIDGKINLLFLPKYKAEGAEERSGQIAQKLIRLMNISEKEKQRILHLVLHLIRETKYTQEKEGAFGQFVRVVDQIGGNLFSENKDKERGLLIEMKGETPSMEFNPYVFYNFVRARFPQLVQDEKSREAILGIWDKQLPDQNLKYKNESIPVIRFLAEFC